MKFFRKLVRLELVLVYLVIMAGSIVRMTGSGMGCPDWPKCFGYLIPPTEKSQLEWNPGRDYKEGQIIIVDESLRVAQGDFTADEEFNPQNWSVYTKHDYARFNPMHTWVEYGNRLFSVLAGIPMIIIFFHSFYLAITRKKWLLPLLSTAALFMFGFEAWLGKLVVDGNLIPGSITIHMLGSLIIIALLVLLLIVSRRRKRVKVVVPKMFKALIIITTILTLVQIVLGTQVREQVDVLDTAGVLRQDWIHRLDELFYIHRSFSIILIITGVWLYLQNRREMLGMKGVNAILLLLILSVVFGMMLNYSGMPAIAQPLHLLLAILLFGVEFYVLCRSFRTVA